MKILLTTDNIGGVWTFTLNLARGLKRNGMDVCVVVIGNKMSDYQRSELSFTSWYFISAKQEWMEDPWNDIRKAGCLLMDITASFRPDIVHLNSYSFGELHWNVPVVITAHSCVLSWWNAVKGGEAPEEWDMYRENVGKGIRAADVVVAPGTAMMKSVEKYYSPWKHKVVINNGSDSSAFHPAHKEKFVFSMGRLWDEAKNIKLVIEAAKEIRYQVFIAGDLTGISTHHLPRNVHFLGRLTSVQIAGWLSEAALYVLPVKYETFGYTFLEAAFSGCAIITGNIDSMREIWTDEAIFVDTEDRSDLADAINSLMADDNKTEFMAMKAREKAMKEYTLEKMTSEYIALYNSTLQSFLKKKLKLQTL